MPARNDPSRSDDFWIKLDEFEALLRAALAATYASRELFDNESDFKFELYHQLHDMKLGGCALGQKLPGHPTSLIHAEGRAVNEHAQKADLIICNPALPRPRFNYRTDIVIELKKTLRLADLRKELVKFDKYQDRTIRRLYVIAAHGKAPSKDQVQAALEDHQEIRSRVRVWDRSTIESAGEHLPSGITPGGRQLLEPVRASIEETLTTYGTGRDQFQGYFWCNYFYETDYGWTYPAEGDFNAKLYHLLRTKLPGWNIQTEYRVGRSRADFFISRSGSKRSVGIEVKINWDQLRIQPRKSKQEVPTILDRFEGMASGRPDHTNFLVVIQGEDGYRPSSGNKQMALAALSETTVPFHLLQYDERRERVKTERFPPTGQPPLETGNLPAGSKWR